MTLLLVIWTLQFSLLYTSTIDAKATPKQSMFQEAKGFFLLQILILVEFNNDIIYDCPLQNKGFRHVCFRHVWFRYMWLEKQSITLNITVNSWENVLMAMYGSDIPSLGKEVLGEIFWTITPSSTVVLLFSGIFLVSCSFK